MAHKTLGDQPAGSKFIRRQAHLPGGLISTYIVKDHEVLKAKKQKFLEDGPEKLIIISDFDRTISTGFITDTSGKKPGLTAYSLLSESPLLSESFKLKSKQYYAKYVPIEFDATIDHDAKVKCMDEWWSLSNQALVDEKTTMSKITEAIVTSTMKLRPGFASVVSVCHQYEIPIIVFSAGIEQIIKEILRTKGPIPLLLPNVHIVANTLEIDSSTGDVIGFLPPLMHSLNKRDHSVDLVKKGTKSWFDESMKRRKNVILMGDNSADASMSDGYGDDATVLKIGFLNDREEELLDLYASTFDLVVLQDGPMVPTAEFINEIVAGCVFKNPVDPFVEQYEGIPN